MYSVVGCNRCDALWVVEGRPETTGCPRCGRRHRFDRLKRLAESDDEDGARQARSTLLAEQSGHGETFADVGAFSELGEHVDDGGVSDEEYLAAAGLDPEEVQAAGERSSDRPTSRLDVVRAALRELEAPDEAAVVAHAAERGVPQEAARRLLERLVEAGEVTRESGRYRLL